MQLQPFLSTSSTVQELLPLPQSLSVLGSTGFEALDNLESGNPVTADQRSNQQAAMDEPAKSQAGLFRVVASGLCQLIAAQRLVQ
jgi:hypothetical protein